MAPEKNPNVAFASACPTDPFIVFRIGSVPWLLLLLLQLLHLSPSGNTLRLLSRPPPT
jgi:hypothetical protein